MAFLIESSRRRRNPHELLFCRVRLTSDSCNESSAFFFFFGVNVQRNESLYPISAEMSLSNLNWQIPQAPLKRSAGEKNGRSRPG